VDLAGRPIGGANRPPSRPIWLNLRWFVWNGGCEALGVDFVADDRDLL
jgi:hypothetical protein